jgi:hypothetical protein
MIASRCARSVHQGLSPNPEQSSGASWVLGPLRSRASAPAQLPSVGLRAATELTFHLRLHERCLAQYLAADSRSTDSSCTGRINKIDTIIKFIDSWCCISVATVS